MSLDTLANVKTRLGVTGTADDSLLTLFQDSADQWVANYCERDFAGGTFTEYFSGHTSFLHVRNFPVATLTSVKVDPSQGFGASTVFPATAYVVQTERGVVQSLVGPFLLTAVKFGLVNADLADWTRSPRAVQVVYTTATSSVPADVKEAYAQLVGHWYRRVKTQSASTFQNLTRQRYGDVTTTFTPEQLGGLPLPPDVIRLLEPYRTPNI